ncbi:DUF1322 family protein (plasmid) [Borrelia sp. CA_690]|nr:MULTISPECIES: DUF1322 family protein [Borrelia]WKC83992.1 DUF1322 family protein [Borrelia sp. CA_690]
MNRQEIVTSCLKYVDYLTREANKYYFPVVMGICHMQRC